jgi:type III pantothenate kinase
MAAKNMLAVDIGNTNITVGIFRGGKLFKKTKMPTDAYNMHEECIGEFFRNCRIDCHDVESVVMSSVVPLALARMVVCMNRRLKVKISILGKDVAAPIKNLYKNKKEVGQDRLVNAYAAKVLYGTPAVIIDFGTAITFDIVSKKGEYLGGLILPGIEMGLASLYDKTALLPKVELKPATSIIGRDTVSSMRGGILFGFGAMCDGLVSQYKNMLGNNIRVIATGGNAKLIKKYSKSIQIVDEDLTLKGLHLISKL